MGLAERLGIGSASRHDRASHEIDFAAVRLDVIDHDVAIRSPPFGAIIDAVSFQQRRRVYGAVGDAAGKSRRISAKQRVSDDRVNAVGAIKSKGAKDFHRVKADLNAGSDTSEASSLLIDGDIDAELAAAL